MNWCSNRTRRQFLIAAGLLVASGGFLSRSASSTTVRNNTTGGIVALDYALVQTLLALGISPIAVTGGDFYRRFVLEPELPPGVAELGTRAEPNLELMRELRPDVVALCPEYGGPVSLLQDIAPVLPLPIFDGDRGALANARRALHSLARTTATETRARQYERHFDELFADTSTMLRTAGVRNVQVISFSTGRLVRIYTNRSLFADALRNLGLGDSIPTGGNLWGFSDVGAERLASYKSQWVVHVGPVPEHAWTNPIWKALPFVQSGRVVEIPPMWMFGGLPSAERFARTLGAALTDRLGNG